MVKILLAVILIVSLSTLLCKMLLDVCRKENLLTRPGTTFLKLRGRRKTCGGGRSPCYTGYDEDTFAMDVFQVQSRYYYSM